MNFADALVMLKDGRKMKRKSWGGYWVWCPIHQDILMHCKGGQVIPLTQTKSVMFTIENMTKTDWEVVRC